MAETLSVVGAVAAIAQVLRSLSLSGFQDTKVHELGLQLETTFRGVEVLVLYAEKNNDEEQTIRARTLREHLTVITTKMQRLVQKNDHSFASRVKRPWYRKQIEELQQRLDGVRRDIQTELEWAHMAANGTTLIPAADALPSYDSLLGVPTDKELPTPEDKAEHVLDDLMRPVRRNTNQRPSSGTEDSLLDVNEDAPSGSTGIDRKASELTQRRPWRNIAHQDVDLPDLAPVIRKTRINYRILRSAMETWMINKFIVYAVFVALIAGSAATAGLAAWKAQMDSHSKPPESSYDDNFYGSISQGLGSILGVFCIVLPLVERNRQLQPDIPVWCPRTFRWLLGFSAVTAVLSMAAQRFEEAGSIVFGYVSMATQLVATMLLVVGSTETITQRQRAFDQLSTRHLIISGALQEARRQAATAAI